MKLIPFPGENDCEFMRTVAKICEMLRAHFLSVAARNAKSTTQIREATQSDNPST